MPSTINDDILSANKPHYKPYNLKTNSTTNITPNPQHNRLYYKSNNPTE